VSVSEFAVAVRVAHYAVVMLLFGSSAFLLAVARPAYRDAAGAAVQELRELNRWLLRVQGWSLAIALASGLLWFVVQASTMSGLPLDAVLDRQNLGTVLNDTIFGRVWTMRLGVAIILSVVLPLARRTADDTSWLSLEAWSGLLAGVLLAALAWAGHAAADQGDDRIIHLSADAVHLLAAGFWLGSLPALVFVLTRAGHATVSGTLPLAARMTRRFSTLGLASIGALVLTGVVNGWYLVGSLPRLFGTQYGHLLLLKLALLALMLALATVNRVYWVPKLVHATDAARGGSARLPLRWLGRDTILEMILGLAIVSIVGVLGITTPGAHEPAVWPFSFTLDWGRIQELGGLRFLVIAAGLGTLAATGVAGLGIKASRPRLVVAGLAGIALTLAVPAWLLAVPAYPDTYLRSPVRYAASSIAHGATLFEEHCASCHGAYGYGDGPASASLPVRPANLTGENLARRRDGDLYWWLTHGIPGTPMPGFGDRLSEGERWDLINFLRAGVAAEQAKTMSEDVEPGRAIAAPDFTFQIDRRAQETLNEQRGRSVVLLVLYTLPDSLARLNALREAGAELRRANVRVIAVPVHAAAASPDMDARGSLAPILALYEPGLVATYTLFGRTASAERVLPIPTHLEFLIDRYGDLRARWLGFEKPGWDRMPDLLWQIQVLNREKPRSPVSERGLH
jgi:putative copper export protein/mono/diheme cytochrome c family protein/peroxiredoxin